MLRRMLLLLAAGVATTALAAPAFAELPKLEVKDTYKVGFAQTESNNPWRIAQTESMQAEAAELGHQLVYTDAAGSAAKQVADVNSHDRAGRRSDLPRPARGEAADPGRDGRQEGRHPGHPARPQRRPERSPRPARTTSPSSAPTSSTRAGARPNGWSRPPAARPRSSSSRAPPAPRPPTTARKGFEDAIADQPGMEIVASQTGDFARDKGRQVAETLLQAHPDADRDLRPQRRDGDGRHRRARGGRQGARARTSSCVSIDGTRDALQAIIDGKLGATVECNPRFGPKAFETMAALRQGREDPGLGEERRQVLRRRQRRGRDRQRLLSGPLAIRRRATMGSGRRPVACVQQDPVDGGRPPLLVMQGIDKAFHGVPALAGASLEVARRRGHGAGRPERRRQVDPDQDPHRRLPPRRAATIRFQGSAGRLPLAARRPRPAASARSTRRSTWSPTARWPRTSSSAASRGASA